MFERITFRRILLRCLFSVVASVALVVSQLAPLAAQGVEQESPAQTSGELGKLGIEFTMADGLIDVTSIFDDSPAFRAGVLADDIITHLDDEAVQGLTLNQAVEKMRGPVNSKIKLRIIRKGQDKPIDVTLVRDNIRARVQSQLLLQLGHSGPVDSVAFSPDGRAALSGGSDGTTRLWDVASGHELRTFTGHSGRVVAFSPDGRIALSGSSDGTARLWDAASGREIRTFTGHSGAITSIVFSPDGRTALSGSNDKRIKLWDVASGREIRTFTGHSSGVSLLAFLPDGHSILSASEDGTVRLWDVESGRELKRLTESSTSIAFSPDGRTVLSGLSQFSNNTLKLWDLASGREIRTFTGHSGAITSTGHSDTITAVTFSRDGRFALSGGSDSTVKLWDVANGRELRTLTGHSGAITSITFSPDGRTALSGSSDGTARLWDVESGRELRALTGYSSGVTSIEFLPDGHAALSGSSDGTARLWDMASGRPLRAFTGHFGGTSGSSVGSVAVSSDGRTAMLGVVERPAGRRHEGTIRLWDVESGRELRMLTGHSGIVNSVTFSPDGRMALSGGSDNTIKLWDVESGRELRTFTGHSKGVSSVAFSPDGRTILSASEDRTIRLWDVESGRELRTLTESSGIIHSVAFSPDGRTALSGGNDDHAVRLWDVENGRELWTFTRPSDKPNFNSAWVNSVAFSPDGRTALSGGSDNTVKLWDVESGRELRTFTGHSSTVLSVTFSPDGRTALSGSSDSTVRLWDVESGRELRAFTGHSFGVISVVFSPDGRTALSGGSDDTVKLWDVASGRELRMFRGYLGEDKSVAFSPDRRIVMLAGARIFLSVEGTVTLWDVASGREIRTFKGYRYAALSPDGHTALSISDDDSNKNDYSSFRLWDVESGRDVRTFTGHTDLIQSFTFSPDGRTALSASNDKTVKLWDVASGREIRTFTGHSGHVTSVVFSPDGHTALSGSWDSTVRLWDVESGRELKRFTGHSGIVDSVAFSPDGHTALSGGHDKTVRLWDVGSGSRLRTFRGHSGIIDSVAFSPTGRTALSAGRDGTVRIWDIETGTELAKMVSFKDGSWLTITPEGFFDASSPEAARNLSIVRGLEVFSVEQVYDSLYRPDLVREKFAGDPNGKVKAAAAQLDLEKVTASGMAPRVAIISPVSGTSSQTDQVVVEATIADQGGGIGKVEWRVNGVTVGLEARGFERVDAPAGSGWSRTVKRTLSLAPGDNKIEVLAYNTKGLIASEPAQVSIKWDGAKTATPPKLYVLAVGVNDYYDSRLRLAYAVPDATALAQGFRKAGEGLYTAVEVKTVLDRDVTLTNLDRVFADLSQKVQPHDVFVFFLAGHGKTRNGRYYFIPYDFRYQDDNSIEQAGMGQDKFQAWFATIQARKSLLLYDTCESGSLTGASTRGSDVEERLGAINRMARATGRILLTATTDDAPALEGYRGHGVFTYAILDAFAHATAKHDGLIEVSGLADYLDEKVPDISYEAFKLRQIPQRSMVGSNFALVRKTNVLAGTQISAQTGSAPIPAKPTKAVVTPVDVKPSASVTAIRKQTGVAGAGPVLVKKAGHSAPQTAIAGTNSGTVGVISGGVDGTYIRITSDLSTVLDDGDRLRVLAMIGKGSVQNIHDIVHLRGVDIGIVQSDVLTFAKRDSLIPGVTKQIQYITKLYDEEVHVLARPEIAAIQDLAGKKVNMDVAGSGTAMTAQLMFNDLQVAVTPTNYDQVTALDKLKSGEIAAMVYVTGQPARLFSEIAPETGLHFLAVPMNEALLNTYMPSTIGHAAYPKLVREGADVDTIAVGAVMAVYGWPVNSERYARVARFITDFFDKLPEFKKAPRHPKWRDVNLAAEVPGWTRFAAARNWLNRHSTSTASESPRGKFNALLSRPGQPAP